MRANPRSLGPRGSPQGDRERARMTWYPHRRVQRKGETGHFITGSPAKRFPCTEQPHCSLPSAFRGWGPAKGWPRVQVRAPHRLKDTQVPPGFIVFLSGQRQQPAEAEHETASRCSSSAETPTEPANGQTDTLLLLAPRMLKVRGE